MRHAGLTPRLLNIGGGYPVRHVKPIPSIEIIGEVVNAAIADLPEDIRVMAEPGRYLVSDAAYFVCRVAGTATRNGKRWMYWDAGVFGGVIEVTEGLRYEILSDRTGTEYHGLLRGRLAIRWIFSCATKCCRKIFRKAISSIYPTQARTRRPMPAISMVFRYRK